MNKSNIFSSIAFLCVLFYCFTLTYNWTSGFQRQTNSPSQAETNAAVNGAITMIISNHSSFERRFVVTTDAISTNSPLFRFAAWNVLAQEYANAKHFQHSLSEALEPRHRYPKIVNEIVKLKADVVCLNEVDNYKYLVHELLPFYNGLKYAKITPNSTKSGVAIFLKNESCK